MSKKVLLPLRLFPSFNSFHTFSLSLLLVLLTLLLFFYSFYYSSSFLLLIVLFAFISFTHRTIFLHLYYSFDYASLLSLSVFSKIKKKVLCISFFLYFFSFLLNYVDLFASNVLQKRKRRKEFRTCSITKNKNENNLTNTSAVTAETFRVFVRGDRK